MSGQWGMAVDKIAARCEVAAKFGGDAVFNRDGAEALGKLLREMARILDTEIEARRMISTQSESPIP